MALMERRQMWRKERFFDEKWALVPTPVSALTLFFNDFSRVNANFAGVTLAPFLSALTIKLDQHHVQTLFDSVPPISRNRLSTQGSNPPPDERGRGI
jgi:hypothetical protein